MTQSISIDELLSHTDWLRRLARGLVRDHHSADDLVQSSLSTALAAPPRQRGRGMRAWLRRVMVNRLRQERRNEANRELLLRHNVARAAEAPSTLALVERTEIQGALIEALLALEEPYRGTLLRRYYGSKSAADIAREDEQPESTVRSRLHRGLARLREKLRAEYGGEDTKWLPAVGALAIPRSTGGVGTGGLVVQMAKTPKLVLVAVPMIGLAVLWTMLAPLTGGPTPPATIPVASGDVEGSTVQGNLGVSIGDQAARAVSLERTAAVLASDGETIEVRVLFPDGNPAAGALVRSVSAREAERENRLRGGPHHPHSEVYRFAILTEEYGEEREADGEGRVWIPVSMDLLLVTALGDSTFAATTIQPGRRDPVTLRLAPDEVLELRSVDRAGQPAGNLPLRVAVRIPGRPDNTLWIGNTNDEGVAEVQHFQLLRPAGRESRSARYGVCFDFPVQPHVTVGFDEPVPTEPVILTAPAHGLLELSFAGPRGDPLVAPIEYYWLQVEFPEEDNASDAFPPGEGRSIGGFPVAGEHVVELPIGLGAQISAMGKFQPMGEIEEVSFAGPQRSGEVVVRGLRLSSDYAVIRGTLRAKEDPRSGDVTLRAVLTRGSDHVAVHAPTLLANGAFEIVMQARPAAWPTGVYLHARDSRGREFGGAAPLAPSDAVDLGVLELAPLTAVVEGTVVDDRGAAVAGAEIQVWIRELGEWVRDRRFQTVSESDGVFRLFVPDVKVGLGLRPQRRGFLVKEPSLSISEPLIMVRAGAISGSVLIPAWLNPSQVAVHALPLAEGTAAERVRPEERGAFRIRDLWPGRYRVQLQLDNEPEPFLDLGVFDVMAGEEGAWDRLRAIDLRADVFRLELSTVDEVGAPLTLPGAGLAVLVRNADGTVHKRNIRWHGDRADVVSSRAQLEVEFVARGWEPWRGVVKPGQNVLHLKRDH